MRSPGYHIHSYQAPPGYYPEELKSRGWVVPADKFTLDSHGLPPGPAPGNTIYWSPRAVAASPRSHRSPRNIVRSPAPARKSLSPPRMAAPPIIKDASIQRFAFSTVSAIHEFLYSHDIREGVAKIRTDKVIHNEDTMLRDVYSFFLKGGAAPAILERLEMPTNYMRPLPIENDIDTTLLVNPAEPKFVDIRNFLIHGLIRFISKHILVESKGDWAEIVGAYSMHKLKLDRQETPIQITTKGGMDGESIALFSGCDGSTCDGIAKDLAGFKFPPNCPFKVEVQASIYFNRKSVGLTLLKILTKTTPAVELLDIAIPISTYSLLGAEWNTKRLLRVHEILDTHVDFYIADHWTTLVDQRLGAFGDTRSKKTEQRTGRADRLKGLVETLQEKGYINSKNTLGKELLKTPMLDGKTFGNFIKNIK